MRRQPRDFLLVSLRNHPVGPNFANPIFGTLVEQTGAVGRSLLEGFSRGDVMLADALYCNYFLIATLRAAGVDVLFEQNGARITDLPPGPVVIRLLMAQAACNAGVDPRELKLQAHCATVDGVGRARSVGHAGLRAAVHADRPVQGGQSTRTHRAANAKATTQTTPMSRAMSAPDTSVVTCSTSRPSNHPSCSGIESSRATGAAGANAPQPASATVTRKTRELRCLTGVAPLVPRGGCLVSCRCRCDAHAVKYQRSD